MEEKKVVREAEGADYSQHQNDPNAKPTDPGFDPGEDVNNGPGVYREGKPRPTDDPHAADDAQHGPGVFGDRNKPAGASDEGADKGPGQGYVMPEGNIHSNYKRPKK